MARPVSHREPRCDREGEAPRELVDAVLREAWWYGKELRAEAPDLHEMKARIPAAMHAKLRVLKRLTGRPIYATVCDALELYFRRGPRQKDSEGGERDG